MLYIWYQNAIFLYTSVETEKKVGQMEIKTMKVKSGT